MGFQGLLEKSGCVGNRRLFLILVVLTFDSLKQTSVGSNHVPAYSVINKKIDYQFDKSLKKFMPIIGDEELLFAKKYTEQQAEQLVMLGKKLYELPYVTG